MVNYSNIAAIPVIADVIRREVRRFAGIAEGEEFRCDWNRVAAAVVGVLDEIQSEHICAWCGFTSESALYKVDDMWFCKSSDACVQRIKDHMVESKSQHERNEN